MKSVVARVGMVLGLSGCCMPYMGSAPPCDPHAPTIWCDVCSPDHTVCRGAGGIGGNCAHLTRYEAIRRYCDDAYDTDEARSACWLSGLDREEFTIECRPWAEPEAAVP